MPRSHSRLRQIFTSRHGARLAVVASCAVLGMGYAPSLIVAGFPTPSGAANFTPLWAFATLVMALMSTALACPAMPEIEVMAGEPLYRASNHLVRLSALAGAWAVLAVGFVASGFETLPALRAFCFWWSLSVLGSTVWRNHGFWSVPVSFAAIGLYWGYTLTGGASTPRAWAVPFRSDHSVTTLAATFGLLGLALCAQTWWQGRRVASTPWAR